MLSWWLAFARLASGHTRLYAAGIRCLNNSTGF
ncbi:hypothetical protein HWC13_gp057 [Nodularia phage vB_NspS-kac68v161]|uniref:Uncharacterized protein n=1 Tax=Nodularia phage vB_NspS-kac68v161 TaxID=2557582 RepID=A0A482MI58_9CAUD|nr:hypothetical protein HWC13_gp057 [Nodularia phage vB_NspS-kac68v161]QBQ73707.1 hypothetical protein kac68v161_gp057 [Nodularia phage vB_NspS-kac68v161]